jgi:hypothetical protein
MKFTMLELKIKLMPEKNRTNISHSNKYGISSIQSLVDLKNFKGLI